MKSLIVSILILGFVGLLVVGLVAKAATSQVINVAVTPGEVSVTVNRTTVDYGTTLINTSKTDPAGTIVATAGSADIDLNFTGANSTYAIGGSGCGGNGICTWTLAGTPGTDAYEHTVTIPPETALTTSAQTLKQDLLANATEDFTLKMYTPSAAGVETNYGSQYSTTVTVTAVYAY